MKLSHVPLLAAMFVATGCGSMSGLIESTSKFSCKAPDGVSCTSVSGVYANAQKNNLPALQSRARSANASWSPTSGGAAFPIVAPGMPIRSQSRTLRLWVAPWVDDDGTLHDQSYMYVMIDPGKWQVEQTREATVQNVMARLRPMGKPRDTGSHQEQRAGQIVDVEAAQAAARETAIGSGEDTK
jgi:conjugal transfer pilus assembly protein TraV